MFNKLDTSFTRSFIDIPIRTLLVDPESGHFYHDDLPVERLIKTCDHLYGGGIAVSMFALYSEDQSSSPA